jgi:hypothetical protein
LRISPGGLLDALATDGCALKSRGIVKRQGLHLDDPARYCIYAQGLFDAAWLDLLSGVWVIHRQQPSGSGITILTGNVADQAALLGVLQQLYCLGFPLLLVEHLTEQDRRVEESARATRLLPANLRLVCD